MINKLLCFMFGHKFETSEVNATHFIYGTRYRKVLLCKRCGKIK